MSTDLAVANLPACWAIPASINWTQGRNRAVARKNQLEANDDLAAIAVWLKRNAKSRETLASYRKEAIRFMLWAVHERGKSMSDLVHEDILAYVAFLDGLRPESRWVTPSRRKLPISHPDWRPFYGPLSEASQRQAMSILNAMYGWFVKAGYLDGNPVSLLRKEHAGSDDTDIERYLGPDDLAMLMESIGAMPDDSVESVKKKARLRWVFVLLFLTGLRISEAVNNTMGGFVQKKDPADGSLKWWLKVTGKGRKTASIPATPELMEELVAYRETFDLPPLPLHEEPLPLVFSLGPARSPLKRQHLHRILKDFIGSVADSLASSGREDEARWLAKVSAHWLRHSLATSLVSQNMNLAQVRDIMRHKSLSTTTRYVHTEANARHDEMVKKHRLPSSRQKIANRS